MYSLSAFFILNSRAPPNTSAAAFITPPSNVFNSFFSWLRFSEKEQMNRWQILD